MLGWSFSVTDQDKKTHAYWEGGLSSDQWLKDLERNGLAVCLRNKGGYPNMWEVYAGTKIVKEKLLEQGVTVENENQWLMVEVWDQS